MRSTRAFNNKAYIEALALGYAQQELSITRHKHYSSKMTQPCFELRTPVLTLIVHILDSSNQTYETRFNKLFSKPKSSTRLVFTLS